MTDLCFDFDALRDKWREVPQGGGRVFSDELLKLDDATLFENWQQYFLYYRRSEANQWYQTLYKEFMRDKTVLEIGSGLEYDGILRLKEGVKEWTFCDIAATNLEVIRRICNRLDLPASFVFIDDNLECFDKLGMFDVIWANGSLINVPFEFACIECMKILPHLMPGGRWIELCYPRERWIREGRLPLSEWGKVTDGERTPWVEWYDLVKMQSRLFPAAFEVILNFNFHNDDYNWFDLLLASDRPFNPNQKVVELRILPSAGRSEMHGDARIGQNNDSSLEVVTPEPMWSYALSFDLAEITALANREVEHGDSTVEVELLVTHGHIGVLLVGEDISTPVCREHMARASTEPTILKLSVAARARRLIFRNVAAIGRSHFCLKAVTLKLLTTPS